MLYVSTLDAIVRVMLPHLDAARERGWQVEVACQVTRFRDELEAHSDRVYDLPMRRFPLHAANGVALARLTRLIRRERYAIVHCHNPTGGFVGRLAATLAGAGGRPKATHAHNMPPLPESGRPLRVYTAHGFHFHRHGGRLTNTLYKSVETFAGQLLSDAVFVINREDYDAAAHGKVAPRSRLFLTGGVGVSARDDFNPENVADDARARIRREWGVAPNAPLLTAVGEMIPRKKHADLLRAFARILPQHPDAVLALVGDGALMDTLKMEAVRLNVVPQVRFPGFRRDVPEILAATDVFVFPSKQEGLPCSIQEALSMQVPVVATDVRGCADLVDDECGRLVPLGRIDALAGAMGELIGLGAAARHRLGVTGREKMLRVYDREACVAEWQGIYDQLLAR